MLLAYLTGSRAPNPSSPARPSARLGPYSTPGPRRTAPPGPAGGGGGGGGGARPGGGGAAGAVRRSRQLFAPRVKGPAAPLLVRPAAPNARPAAAEAPLASIS